MSTALRIASIATGTTLGVIVASSQLLENSIAFPFGLRILVACDSFLDVFLLVLKVSLQELLRFAQTGDSRIGHDSFPFGIVFGELVANQLALVKSKAISQFACRHKVTSMRGVRFRSHMITSSLLANCAPRSSCELWKHVNSQFWTSRSPHSATMCVIARRLTGVHHGEDFKTIIAGGCHGAYLLIYAMCLNGDSLVWNGINQENLQQQAWPWIWCSWF